MSAAERDKWNARYRDGAYENRTHPTALLAEFADHKPEAIVQLGPACAAVLFDDVEKYKQQQRAAGGGSEWETNASFVSYLAVPP